MLNGQHIVVVMPAAMRRGHSSDPRRSQAHGVVDLVIVVDDASHDETVAIARNLETCRWKCIRGTAVTAGTKRPATDSRSPPADIVIMFIRITSYAPADPPDGGLVASGLYPCVLGSRILGGGALRGGMPWWKYVANRFLTLVENFSYGAKLSESHTGYRAFRDSFWRGCRWKKTPMILFSIMECWRKSSPLAAQLAK